MAHSALPRPPGAPIWLERILTVLDARLGNSNDSAKTEAALAEANAKAYADGIVTTEERRAIADAQAKYDAVLANISHNRLGPDAGPEYSTVSDTHFHFYLRNTPLVTLALAPGDVISVSADVYQNGAENARVGIFLEIKDAAGTFLVSLTDYKTATGFIRSKVQNVVIPASAATVTVFLHNPDSTTAQRKFGRHAMLNRGRVALPFEQPPFRAKRENADDVQNGAGKRVSTNEEARGGGKADGTIPATGQLSSGTTIKESSVALNIARGIRSGECKDGVGVSFVPAFERTPAVLFGMGGRTFSAGIAGDQVISCKALNLSASGFTPQLKISGTTGALTDRSATFSGTDADKGTAAEAFDQTYRFNYAVTVNQGVFVSTVPGDPLNPSSISLGFYTNDGAGWVLRATRGYSNDDNVAVTYAGQTVDVTVAGMGLSSDFRIAVVQQEGNGGSVSRNSVTWKEGSAPASASMTGGGATPVPFLALAGT